MCAINSGVFLIIVWSVAFVALVSPTIRVRRQLTQLVIRYSYAYSNSGDTLSSELACVQRLEPKSGSVTSSSGGRRVYIA